MTEQMKQFKELMKQLRHSPVESKESKVINEHKLKNLFLDLDKLIRFAHSFN